MKLLIIQFSPASLHFVPVDSKHLALTDSRSNTHRMRYKGSKSAIPEYESEILSTTAQRSDKQRQSKD